MTTSADASVTVPARLNQDCVCLTLDRNALCDALIQETGDPAYRAVVIDWAPASARQDFGPRGAFMGYDFHMGQHGPALIEINTNAGGAMLNAVLAQAQQACCASEPPDLLQTGGFETVVA